MLNAELLTHLLLIFRNPPALSWKRTFEVLRLLHTLRAVPVSLHLSDVDNLTRVISVMCADPCDR